MPIVTRLPIVEFAETLEEWGDGGKFLTIVRLAVVLKDEAVSHPFDVRSPSLCAVKKYRADASPERFRQVVEETPSRERELANQAPQEEDQSAIRAIQEAILARLRQGKG